MTRDKRREMLKEASGLLIDALPGALFALVVVSVPLPADWPAWVVGWLKWYGVLYGAWQGVGVVLACCGVLFAAIDWTLEISTGTDS
jgi:hypothetical protein